MMLMRRFRLAFPFACALLALREPVRAQTVLKDAPNYLELRVPSGWVVSAAGANDDDGALRYKIFSPNKQQALFVYVFQSDHDVDLLKLLELDVKLGWEIGNRSKEQSIDASTKRRTYSPGPRGLQATALFRTVANRGYVVMALSADRDLRFADDVFTSVVVNVPWLKRFWNSVRSRLGSVGGIILGLLGLVGINLLGRAGAVVRKGVEAKRGLKRLQLERLQSGAVSNEKLRAADRKATLRIFVPTVGFTVALVTAFVALPVEMAAAGSLLLVAPALGYFGILLGPSLDPSDYLED